VSLAPEAPREVLLERGDLPRERRLRHEEGVGRGREGAEARNGLECAQLLELHET
jgi:hypothetical protein